MIQPKMKYCILGVDIVQWSKMLLFSVNSKKFI